MLALVLVLALALVLVPQTVAARMRQRARLLFHSPRCAISGPPTSSSCSKSSTIWCAQAATVLCVCLFVCVFG